LRVLIVFSTNLAQVKKGDQAAADDLRQGATLYRALSEGFKSVQSLLSCSAEEVADFLAARVMLCDPAFHDLLDLRARLAIRADELGDAQNIRGAREYLINICRLVHRASELPKAAIDGKDNLIRWPSSSEQAEMWFLMSREFSETCINLAQKVVIGEQPLDAAVTAACCAFSQQMEERKRIPIVHAIAAFYEFVLMTEGSNSLFETTLRRYRALLDSEEYIQMGEEEQSTLSLRYAKALQRHWRKFAEPISQLRDAVEILGQRIPATDPERSPRLLRDLYFTRARHLENLALWSPAEYATAEDNYVCGLSVLGAAHEIEARGMALSDLASTIRHRYAGQIPQHDQRIISLYEEALSCLPANFPLNRGTVLNNFATYFNERPIGDPISNQERALNLANESVTVLETLVKDRSMTVFERNSVASAYNTKANLLRHRIYGMKAEGLVTAQEAYRRALEVLGTGLNRQFEGLLWINLGNIEIDLYQLTKDIKCLERADEAFIAGEGLVQEYPREHARAVLARAGLALEEPYRGNTNLLTKGIQAITTIMTNLVQVGDLENIARAKWLEGCLLKARPAVCSEADLVLATECFIEAANLYEAIGSVHQAIGAKLAAVGCCVRKYALDGMHAPLQAAKTLLLESAQLGETLWKKLNSVEWHHEISALLADIYGELTWCEAALGGKPYDVVYTATRAKGREILEHISALGRRRTATTPQLRDYLDGLRMYERMAEIGRWAAQRQVQTGSSILSSLEGADRVIHDVRKNRELFATGANTREQEMNCDQVKEQIESYLQAHPASMILDITVCRWGTVVFTSAGKEVQPHGGPKTYLTPLTSSSLENCLWGSTNSPGWHEKYQSYLSAEGRLKQSLKHEWEQATEELVRLLATEVLCPAFSTLDPTSIGTLLVVPGTLAGLPLHAAEVVKSVRLCDLVKGLAYVPSVTLLSTVISGWKWPTKSLCILSDLESEPKKQLNKAPAETASIAQCLGSLNTEVHVIAAVGTEVGKAVFERRRIQLPDTISILDHRPTPEWLRSNAHEYDLVFYSGHGIGPNSEGLGGIILSDAEGHQKVWTGEDVLAAPELVKAPLFFLSTCEIAGDPMASTGTDLFNFASCLLRIGSSVVIGSAWVIRDDCAHVFGTQFFAALHSCWDPAEAFCVAIKKLREYLAAFHLKEYAQDRTDMSLVDWVCFMPFVSA
jgi:tetratricopeptide (TPR) repeat protein